MGDPAHPEAPATPASLSIGDVVADRYRIDAVLGEGGMGIVYRAEHLHLRKLFAVKVLLPEWSSMPEVVARFEREAIAAGNIQSPHVVSATDFGRLPNGSFFLAMEHVNGRTLATVLEAGALDPARALHVVRGIVSALHAAHALGIVHRDLKPENIMLIQRGDDPDFVKVLDFGIAKVEGFQGGSQEGTSKPLTQVGAIMGTPRYMSPEQALGQPVDARSDLYSLGIIFFEMLAGFCPFEGDAVTVLRQRITGDVPELPAAVAATVDPRLGVILRQLLARSPENRLASSAEVMAALDECLNERGTAVAPAPMRPSLESVHAMTTPVAQRVRMSVLSGVKALDGAARRMLADPKAVLRSATQVRRAAAQKVHTAVGPLLRAIDEAIRRALVDPRTLRAHMTPRRVAVGAVVVVIVATMIVVLEVASRTRVPTSAPTPVSADSAPFISPATSSPIPGLVPTESADIAPVSTLPPPPTPSSAPGRPASSQGPARKTGPGGIYIPPPSQWFK